MLISQGKNDLMTHKFLCILCFELDGHTTCWSKTECTELFLICALQGSVDALYMLTSGCILIRSGSVFAVTQDRIKDLLIICISNK